MPTTFHLARADEWSASLGAETYAPPAFEREGFIHCTDGVDEMVATANRYYRADPGPFVVVEVDLELVDARVVYEDERHVFPHVYGRLPRRAVVSTRGVERAEDGTFTGFGGPSRP